MRWQAQWRDRGQWMARHRARHRSQGGEGSTCSQGPPWSRPNHLVHATGPCKSSLETRTAGFRQQALEGSARPAFHTVILSFWCNAGSNHYILCGALADQKNLTCFKIKIEYFVYSPRWKETICYLKHCRIYSQIQKIIKLFDHSIDHLLCCFRYLIKVFGRNVWIKIAIYFGSH